MPRPPRARSEILDAAERIVKERGAANLTYEELVQQSGVSRGGITYHFATKEDLLRALIERDLEQGMALEQQHCQTLVSEPGADLIALIRAWCEPDSERRRFIAGMLSAVAHDPSLLEPVRNHHRQLNERTVWNDNEIRRSVIRLAAEGLFWSEFFGCNDVPNEHRPRVVAELERLAREWSAVESAPVQPIPKTKKPRG
jgi:AcrR family transcriptional regulator